MIIMKKSEVIEKFFNNSIKEKNLIPFKDKTPMGNYVSGWICKQEGQYLSSMLLETIKTKDKVIKCNRFIKGMPKQHYYSNKNWSLFEDSDFTVYYCHEKLDGTCLILYALYDEDDQLIEIVPRTRGMAVAASNIIDMYNMIDKAQIEQFYSYPHNLDYILMFELYGILNRHEIVYNKNYIDINLIGATIEDRVLDYKEVLVLSFKYYFEMPDRLFEIVFFKDQWSIHPQPSRLYPYYIDEDYFLDKKYDSLEACIHALSDAIEIVNQNYKEKNGHIALEGLVINGFNQNKGQRYVKIKPESVLKIMKLGNGIPRYAIRKEVYKYFDEYGAIEVKNIYEKDKLHYLQFVKEKLLEEFPENLVNSSKTSKKISNVFFDIWESKTPSLTVQNVAQELASKYSGQQISDVMKTFAKEYPSLKNRAGEIYSVLKHLL